ncbi:MAG: PrsW family intramembrane metalloprotease [Streptosporangiales bacterium]|nr:PrsW family intramembrane metalloprotease [Streptosporangiales bacterium]
MSTAPGGVVVSGEGVPRRRSWSHRLAWVAVLIAGVAAYLLVLRTLVTTENLNFFPSLILLGAMTVPITVLVFAWGSGPAITASPGLVVFTALTGGIVGTVTAGTLEYDTLHRLGALPMLGVGLIEETAKLVVPVALLLFLPSRGRQAGVIIGIASGMGFATLETMGYGFSALLSERSIAAVDQTLLLRGLLAPAGHVAWTGMTTAALWRIPTAPHRARAALLAIGALVLAVLLHTGWDALNSIVAHVVIGTVSLVLLLILIGRSHRAGAPATARRRSQ